MDEFVDNAALRAARRGGRQAEEASRGVCGDVGSHLDEQLMKQRGAAGTAVGPGADKRDMVVGTSPSILRGFLHSPLKRAWKDNQILGTPLNPNNLIPIRFLLG